MSRTKEDTLTVAALQYCGGPTWEENRRHLDALLPQAAGADLVLLPENMASYGGDYRAVAAQSAAIIRWLSQTAVSYRCWLVAGSLPLLTREDGSSVPAPKVCPAQLVFSPDGKQVARYDKMHLFDVDVDDKQGSYRESAIFEAGNRLVTQEMAGLSCGLAICYDVRFAAQALALAQAGAKLLLYPSAFTHKTGAAHWEVLLRSRAIETGCYVLAANQCGQHNAKRASYGHSMLVDPWGQIVAKLDDKPGVLKANISRRFQTTIRQQLPLLSHQRFQVELSDGTEHDRKL